MEHSLVLGALGLGFSGWLGLFLLLLPRRAAPVSGRQTFGEALSARRSFVLLAFLLPILVCMATLPVQAPFSSGQGWGRGFLLGGLVAFFTISAQFRALSRSDSPWRLPAVLPFFGALIGVCVPLLWMRSAVIEALLGASLGWICVSLVFSLGISSSSAKTDSPQETGDALAGLVLNGAAFAVALFSVAALGVYRDFVFPDVPRGTYPAVAVAFACSIALTLLIVALLGETASGEVSPLFSRPNTAFFAFILPLLVLVVPLGVGHLLATKILDDLALVYVIVLGLALGGLLWVLVREAAQDEVSTNPAENRRNSLPIAAILVALCGFMLAYQLMQGFGVGLMLLAAWPASILALPTSSGDQNPRPAHLNGAQRLSILGAFLAILLVSRLFATRFRAELHGNSLDDSFALFGFLAGAFVPALLVSLWLDNEKKAVSRSVWRIFPVAASLPRLFCIGILALVLPGAMLSLWGPKIVPAFLIGLALSIGGFSAVSASRLQSVAALLSLSLAVTLTQWTQRFLPLAEVSRAQRLHFLFWAVGSVVFLILIVDYGARLVFWMQNRRALKEGVAS